MRTLFLSAATTPLTILLPILLEINRVVKFNGSAISAVTCLLLMKVVYIGLVRKAAVWISSCLVRAFTSDYDNLNTLLGMFLTSVHLELVVQRHLAPEYFVKIHSKVGNM